MLFTDYTAAQKREMLEHARSSIARELGYHIAHAPVDADWKKEERAAFVTLYYQGELRGCIGSLTAYQALWSELEHNAKAAAFDDPRFLPMSRTEFADIDVQISILTPTQSITVTSRDDLLTTLRPHIDGLLLEDGEHRATFLPQVWGQLSDPAQFLSHLLRKAGLAGDYWSDTMRCSIYQVLEVKESGKQ